MAEDNTPSVDAKTAAGLPAQDLLHLLRSQPQGLTQAEAAGRLAQSGPNSLPEPHAGLLQRMARYFWGPIPWMIETAALLSAIVRHWPDLVIIVLLLLFNAAIGFWQEHKANSALGALKQQLALQCRVKRDGQWGTRDAAQLVDGDIVRVRLGDIVPADIKLLDGEYLSVDQSALTGESLPVSRKPGDVVFSGSIVRQGDMTGVVYATGIRTYLGQTAQLVQKAGAASHFQRAVLNLGDFLIVISLTLVAVLLLVELQRGQAWIDLLQFALILTVASIPVALPAVLSVTMALGALALSRQKAIVAKLESIEELAAVDVLCTDKTGTLTQNRLTLGDTLPLAAADAATLTLHAALASQGGSGDAIDQAVYAAVPGQALPAGFTALGFTPFDPVSKRSEGRWRDAQGVQLAVTKGAPQVIVDLCAPDAQTRRRAQDWIDAQAARGLRTLAVASRTGEGAWRLDGLLALFDPPRADSRHTIAAARDHGLAVKMITGDNVAIAREISGQLGIGTRIVAASEVFAMDAQAPGVSLAEKVDAADGFAEVFPQHKYGIVKALQDAGHRVAMTGDGVNDAPALKQADVGIAVSGASDAARAAAALILTAPGLSTIVNAVDESRRIFERMNSYAIYRVTETIRIMVFVVAAMLIDDIYPITAVMIILLAFFNDVPIMTIAYDRTAVDPQPVRWDMRRIVTVSMVLGLIGVGETLGLLWYAHDVLALDIGSIQTFVFLKLAVSGHLTLFVARSKQAFWQKPWPAPALLWSAVVTKLLATLFVLFPFGLIAPIGWKAVVAIWAYCVFWAFVEDRAKLAVYRRLQHDTPRHRDFVQLLKQRTFNPR